jgi:hypothetical protein
LNNPAFAISSIKAALGDEIKTPFSDSCFVIVASLSSVPLRTLPTKLTVPSNVS